MHKGDANSIFRTFLMAMPGSYSFEPDTLKRNNSTNHSHLWSSFWSDHNRGIGLVLSSDVTLVLCTRLMLLICWGTKVQDRWPLPFIQKLGSQLDLGIWIWKTTRTNVTFGSYQTLLQFHRCMFVWHFSWCSTRLFFGGNSPHFGQHNGMVPCGPSQKINCLVDEFAY